MKLRNMIARGFIRAARSLVGPDAWNIFGSAFSSGTGISGKLSLSGLSRPAENMLWVANCMRARKEAIQQAPLRISDTNDNLIEGGPLYDLLAKPNSWQDGSEFFGAVEALLTIFDCAYIVPVGENSARPNELMLLNPMSTSPIIGIHKPTGMKVPMGWRFNSATGEMINFLLDEVIAIVGFNPHNPLVKSLDPMAALKRSLQMDLATREQNLGLFLNGGVPDFALVTDKPWNDEQAKEFLRKFMDNYSGVGNAHKPALLYNGVKIETFGLKPQDLQSLEVLRTLTPQEIVSGLRCKPVMAGLMVGETGLSQGTSTNEQKIAWWSETGNSELARIASAIQQFLVDKWDWSASGGRALTFGERAEKKRQRNRMRPFTRADRNRNGLTVWFDTSQVPELMEHRWGRSKEMDLFLNRGWRPDEINEYLDMGLPPHPTNEGLIPFNLQPVTAVISAAENSEEAPRIKEDKLSRSLSLMDRISRLIAEEKERAIAKKWKAVRDAFDAFLAPREKALASKYSRFLFEQKARLLKKIKGFELRGARDDRADKEYEDAVMKTIFDLDEENREVLKLIAPMLARQFEDGWDFFNEHENPTSKKPEFPVSDPRVVKALDARNIQTKKINDTTEDDLREILKKAFEEGIETTQELADRIGEYYKGHKARPQTAARTQVAGVVNEGRLLAAKEVGGLKKGWLHGAPDEARPEHVAAQSKYLSTPIELDKKFIVNGYECDAPGSAELPVGETANCTCMVTFVAGKEEEK